MQPLPTALKSGARVNLVRIVCSEPYIPSMDEDASDVR